MQMMNESDEHPSGTSTFSLPPPSLDHIPRHSNQMEDSDQHEQFGAGASSQRLPHVTKTRTRQDNHVQRPGSPGAIPDILNAHTASQAGISNQLGELGQNSGEPWRLEKAQTDPPALPEAATHTPDHPSTPGNLVKRKRRESNSTSLDFSKRRYITSAAQPLLNTGFLQANDSYSARQGPGFFNGAHNMVVNQPSMTEIKTQNVVYGQATEVLQWLMEYTMHGAEFDSSERDPPPRCHPGTRESIIERAHRWIQDDERQKKLWWLHGPAGVGKSAIIQTLVERQSSIGCLGAAIFFSRPQNRNNPQELFPTLAYQFAVRDPTYRSYLGGLMAVDPNCLRKSMNEQFRILIVEPFARLHMRSESEILVVALDGLDECGGDTGGHGRFSQVHPNGHHSDRTQREIVRLISGFVLQYPLVPLIWVISSRPEPHLKAIFYNEQTRPSFWEENMPVDSKEACRDVEKYLHTEFTRIRQDYPDVIPTPIWPDHVQFLQIASRASGLFAFASVIIRFIDDPWVGNPVAQLYSVLAALSRVLNIDQENPLAPLDVLYTEILSRISRKLLHTTKRLLGAFVFLGRSYVGPTEYGFRCICNLLDIKRDAAISALRGLHSVLQIPDPQNIAINRPRFYHASFQDYLEDRSRSKEYWIDQDSSGHELFWGSIPLMKALYYQGTSAQQKRDTFVGIHLPWPDEESGAELHQSAQKVLRCIFHGDISQFGANVNYYTTVVWLPDHELQSILENLSPKTMVKGTANDRAFLRSFVLNDIPCKSELMRRQFLSETTIESLFIGKAWAADSTTVSVDIVQWTVSVYLGEPPIHERQPNEVARDQEVIDQMMSSVRAAPTARLLTLGTTESERSVVCYAPVTRDRFKPEAETFFITGV